MTRMCWSPPLLLISLSLAALAPAGALADSDGGSDSGRELADIQSGPWTHHDPGFPVRIGVAPFADAEWDPALAESLARATGTLHVPSSVLNITVALPPVANLTSAAVSITLFRRRRRQPAVAGASSRDLLGGNDSSDDGAGADPYRVMADTQVQYAQSYRVDVGTKAQRMVLRVHVEALAVGATLRRAFHVQPLDLSPSAAVVRPDCSAPPEPPSAVEMRIASFPPTNMPADLCAQYTMGGRVPVRKWYFDDQTDLERTYEPRSREFIETLVIYARERKRYYYGLTDDYLYAALDEHPITGQHVLIVGSTIPWYESICLAMGAASCTTVDYNRLQYDHPGLATLTLAELAAASPPRRFDTILSISSFEHDGLGRYGDPLEPDADLRAMRGLREYAHSTTRVFLAVPVGPDAVVWNAQRIYGPLRLPLLLEDWDLVDSFGFDKSDLSASFRLDHQPVFVLAPTTTAAAADTATNERDEL